MILVNKSDNSQEVTLVSGGSITLPPNNLSDIGSKVAATPLPYDVEIIQGATTTTVQPTNGVSYPTFPFKGMVVSGLNSGKTEYWDGTAWVTLAVSGAATPPTTTNSAPSYLRVTKTPLPVGSFVKVDTMPDNRRASSIVWDGQRYWNLGGITGIAGTRNNTAIAYDPVTRTYTSYTNTAFINTAVIVSCADLATNTIYFMSGASNSNVTTINLYKMINGVVTVIPVTWERTPTLNFALIQNTPNGAGSLYVSAYPTLVFNNNSIYLIVSDYITANPSKSNMYKIDLGITPKKGKNVASLGLTLPRTSKVSAPVQDANFLYSLSGYDYHSNNYIAGLFKFEFATETWSQIVATGEPAPGHYSGTMIGTDIYYLNYNSIPNPNDRFFKFDTLTNTWNNLSLMINPTLLADTTFPEIASMIATDGTTIDIFGGGAPSTASTNGALYLNTHWQYRPAIGYSGVASRTSVASTAIATSNGWGAAPLVYTYKGFVYCLKSGVPSRAYSLASDSWSQAPTLVKAPIRAQLAMNESNAYYTIYDNLPPKVCIVEKATGFRTYPSQDFGWTSSVTAVIGDTVYRLSTNKGILLGSNFIKFTHDPTTNNSTVVPVAITQTSSNPLASYKSLTCSTATTFFLWNNTIGSQTLSEYDTVTNMWTTFPPFVTTPSDVVYSSMLHLKGFIYMVSNTTDELWKYDIAQNAWFNLSGAFLSTGVLPLRRATLTTDGTDIFIVPTEIRNKTWFRYIP